MATTQQTDVDPFTAVEALRTALDSNGLVLPSLAVDPASPGPTPIDLGRIRADVALRLAAALQRRAVA
ncbi:hypothetical protein KVH27_19655 [Streptomyces olivaceus]|uniref:hypothetical protein n=1 Tax=Streptomyces olivaceus TaxID=47716 RepID=UPI001CCE9976|nr:hypothetical protein [Streptomyces olivaceus]MBZ6250585.1 hypothetical protein [Streptomyces olivaceus]